MPITKDYLDGCEDLIARGRPEMVVRQLLQVKEETGILDIPLRSVPRWQSLNPLFPANYFAKAPACCKSANCPPNARLSSSGLNTSSVGP